MNKVTHNFVAKTLRTDQQIPPEYHADVIGQLIVIFSNKAAGVGRTVDAGHSLEVNFVSSMKVSSPAVAIRTTMESLFATELRSIVGPCSHSTGLSVRRQKLKYLR